MSERRCGWKVSAIDGFEFFVHWAPGKVFRGKSQRVSNRFQSDFERDSSVSLRQRRNQCFDSWESSNNRKYYFTSIKIENGEIILLLSAVSCKERETRLHRNLVKIISFCPRLSTFRHEQRKFLNTFRWFMMKEHFLLSPTPFETFLNSLSSSVEVRSSRRSDRSEMPQMWVSIEAVATFPLHFLALQPLIAEEWNRWEP